MTKSAIAAIIASALLVGGLYNIVRGVRAPWVGNSDADMQTRYVEYGFFRQHIYPDKRVAAASGVADIKVHSVYPPYAHPMFAAVFCPPSSAGARAVFQALTLLGLVALVWYGAAVLSPWGWQGTVLGAAIPLAISGNWMAVAMGQFSIISVSLVSVQIVLLKRNRPMLAGVAWGLAMIKPQIALPFAALFCVPEKGGARGFLYGVSLLGLLTAAALWWTGVSPGVFLQEGVAKPALKFVNTSNYGAGIWVQATGVNPRFAACLGLALVAATAAFVYLRRRTVRALDLETTAALASAVSVIAFYHMHYDNGVLCFLLLALASAGLGTRNWIPMAAFLVLGALSYIPHSKVEALTLAIPAVKWLELLAPIGAALALLSSTRSVKNSP